MMPFDIESLQEYLTPELLEQLAIPLSVLLAFLWLFSRRRSNATRNAGILDAQTRAVNEKWASYFYLYPRC